MKKIFRIGVSLLVCLIILAVIITLFTGCTEADRVQYNISKEADAFNVVRKITVLNARTDTIMLEMVGTFSLKNNSSHELEVICEVADGVYKKHFIYLSEYTLYVVEDISGSDVSKYYYELNILPYTGPLVVPEFTD